MTEFIDKENLDIIWTNICNYIQANFNDNIENDTNIIKCFTKNVKKLAANTIVPLNEKNSFIMQTIINFYNENKASQQENVVTNNINEYITQREQELNNLVNVNQLSKEDNILTSDNFIYDCNIKSNFKIDFIVIKNLTQKYVILCANISYNGANNIVKFFLDKVIDNHFFYKSNKIFNLGMLCNNIQIKWLYVIDDCYEKSENLDFTTNKSLLIITEE